MSARLLALAAVPTFVALIAAAPSQPTSTAQGAYTEAQATAGATVYKAACADCHGDDMAGNFEVPTLTGRFVANWANAPVAKLFDYVSKAMPQSAPGSLSPEDNAKVVAFLLKANGAPAGATPLPADSAALGKITFEPPKPAK